ncbi:MAG: peptidyl-prolyl cis-trans isomerase, partial [Verrucomicrobiota bacterium]
GQELQRRLEKVFEMGLNMLIEQNLILQDFKSEEGDIPDKMVDDQIEKQIATKFSNDRTAFLKWLEEEKQSSFNEYRKQVKEDLTVMILRRREVISKVAIPPTTVRKVYEEQKSQFVRPEEVLIRMIVLKPGAEAGDADEVARKAQVILNRLENNDDFANLAKSFSTSTSAAKGGAYDWKKPSSFRKEIADAINELSPGDFSPTLKIGESLYIIKLEERKLASAVPFDQLKDKIENQIRRTEEDRLYKAWIDRLKKNHHVKIF